MGWKRLLSEGRAQAHTTSATELDELRALVTRNLKDAALVGLSADNRLGLAYEAALIAAKMAIACAGHRIRGQAHHKTTFEALPLAMGAAEQPTADLFEGFRRDRNLLSYDAAGIISESDAQTALDEARALFERVEKWIAAQHPRFQRPR